MDIYIIARNFPRQWTPWISRFLRAHHSITIHRNGICTNAIDSNANNTSNDPQMLDRKWQKIWQENNCKRLNDGAEKYYVLAMFPYPSGKLHIGHLRVYTVSDVLARYRRMKGYDVIHAMGWDAFGLPAENAAIERGVEPRLWTLQNIDKMKDQMHEMLADFDWEREVVTCAPEYYKWTQKLFLMLHEHGYAYRKLATVNWDPVEQTVLANEQVDEQGRSWRSGALIEKKKLNQWFLAITKFADELVDDLQVLDQWPEKVKTMQRNWIGQSNGTKVKFPTIDHSVTQFIDVFTTRPDTIPGVQYLALSVEHPLVVEMSNHDPLLVQFLERAKTLDPDSKEGFELKGIRARNPIQQDSDVPIFVAPYVLAEYGSGAVMGVPAHDERDYNFWSLNRPESPLVEVIDPPHDVKNKDLPIYSGKNGVVNAKGGPYRGLSTIEAGQKITETLSQQNLGGPCVQLRLRDWLVSRQRFWGAPIPIIHCDTCGPVPVPDQDLPVKLPETLDSRPLAQNEEFLKTECPQCHGPAHRDSDTMDTFMDSSWYFFRYTDPKNDQRIFDYATASKQMPVDLYIGGVEHAILHLLYSRFISKFLKKAGAWDGGKLNGEPIEKLVTQGMVHGKTFIEPTTGRFLTPGEVVLQGDQPLIKGTSEVPLVSYEKMSKSKHNGADPSECIRRHGADSTRAHILFQAPLADVLNWDESKIVGIERWLARVGALTDRVILSTETSSKEGQKLSASETELWNEIQMHLISITNSLDKDLSMNTIISDYMKMTKAVASIESNDALLQQAFEILIKVISPVAPAHAEEYWQRYLSARKQKWTSIFLENWPEPAPVKQDVAQYSVIINGKRRLSFEASVDLLGKSPELLKIVQEHPGSAKWLTGQQIRSVIVREGNFNIVIMTKPCK